MAYVCSVASARNVFILQDSKLFFAGTNERWKSSESFQWLKGTVTGFMGTGLHSPDKQDAAFKKCEYQWAKNKTE